MESQSCVAIVSNAFFRDVARSLQHVIDRLLADHGQAPCTPYRDLTGGRRFERPPRWDLERTARALELTP